MIIACYYPQSECSRSIAAVIMGQTKLHNIWVTLFTRSWYNIKWPITDTICRVEVGSWGTCHDNSMASLTLIKHVTFWMWVVIIRFSSTEATTYNAKQTLLHLLMCKYSWMKLFSISRHLLLQLLSSASSGVCGVSRSHFQNKCEYSHLFTWMQLLLHIAINWTTFIRFQYTLENPGPVCWWSVYPRLACVVFCPVYDKTGAGLKSCMF